MEKIKIRVPYHFFTINYGEGPAEPAILSCVYKINHYNITSIIGDQEYDNFTIYKFERLFENYNKEISNMLHSKDKEVFNLALGILKEDKEFMKLVKNIKDEDTKEIKETVV